MRKLDEKSMGNAALYYLKRYSATKKGLSDVLERKARRHARLKKEELDLPAVRKVIDAVVERMVRAGYVDDTRLAESKSASLHRQGKSARVIALKLRQKGVPADVIAKTTDRAPESELEAALTLVRKKKLGRDPERRQKDLAVLMRAGFGWDIAKRALAQATVPT